MLLLWTYTYINITLTVSVFQASCIIIYVLLACVAFSELLGNRIMILQVNYKLTVGAAVYFCIHDKIRIGRHFEHLLKKLSRLSFGFPDNYYNSDFAA